MFDLLLWDTNRARLKKMEEELIKLKERLSDVECENFDNQRSIQRLIDKIEKEKTNVDTSETI